MKICIELDEKMEETWNTVKRNLESELQYAHGVSVTLTDYFVLMGLLGGWENELAGMWFAG